MKEINISDLPESLNDKYIVIISKNPIEVNSLDKYLNSHGVVVGLVDEFTYLIKSKEMTSMIVHLDYDSVINENLLNSKISEDTYVYSIDKYYDMIKSYSYNNDHKSGRYVSFYGMNDVSVVVSESEDGESSIITIISPFLANKSSLEKISSIAMNLLKVSYGVHIEYEDISDKNYSSIMVRFRASMNFDLMDKKRIDLVMNQLISFISTDKYIILSNLSNFN